MGLHGEEKSLMTSLAVWIRCTSVTERHRRTVSIAFTQ